MVSPRIVDSFGDTCFARGLSPLKKREAQERTVLGFDTEYTPAGECVCYQLSYKGRGRLFEGAPTLHQLSDAVEECCGFRPLRAVLVSFFSVAELQHLPVFRKARRVWYYGGSVDVAFEETNGTAIHVVDIARFFPRETLAHVAERFGLKKLKLRRRGIERVSKRSLRERAFREYAIRDAELTDTIFERMQAASPVDLLRHPTPAMSASATLRSGWIAEEVKPPSPVIRRAALLSLHGGRAEAYFRGRVAFAREYDIKSSYPNACVSFGALPTKGDWRRASTLRDSDVGYVECSWDFGGEAYPCLGQEVEGVLLFASRGQGWVTVDEFRLADSLGARLRVFRGRTAREQRGNSALPEFMRTMLDRRKEAGAAGIVAKLAANSVIGKLGQKTRIVDWNGWLSWLRQHVSEADFLEGIQLQADMIRALGFDGGWSFGSCYCPEWASLILGRARSRISELAHKAKALYVHTDSVWTRGILDEPDLSIKAEGSCVVARGKVGFLGERIAHHGVKDAKLARKALEQIGDGFTGPRSVSGERPVRFREWCRIGGRLGRWLKYEKKIGFHWDDKRKLLGNGETVPWKDPLEFLEARKKSRAARRLEHDQEVFA